MFRRLLVAVVVVLALVSTANAVVTASADPSRALVTHKLIAAVKKNLAPAAEKKVAVLILISQGGPPSGAVARPSKALTVFLDNRGLYRVKAQIDSTCKGSCAASYRFPARPTTSS